MSLRPIVRFRQKLTLAALALAAFLIWLAPATFAEVVRVKLSITVNDENGKPVPKAQISVPRQGLNDRKEKLKDIDGETNGNGQFTEIRDFQLTGIPHKILITASDLKAEQTLSDQQFRDAVSKSDGALIVHVSLKPERQDQMLVISGTVTDQAGQPILEAVISLGKALGDPAIEATTKSRAEGRFELPPVEFEPGDAPRNLKVVAAGFQDFELHLTKEELGKISNNILRLNPIRLVAQPSVFQQFKNGLDWLFWSLGLLLVLGLGIYLGYRMYRWLTPTPLRLSTRYLVEEIYRDVHGIKKSMLTEPKLAQVFTRSLNDWSGKSGEQDSKNHKQDDNSTTIARGSATTRDSVTARGGSQSKVPQVELVRDPQSIAQEAYQNLLNKIPVDQEPVYLDVEGPRSAAGKLEDKTVYLTQVSHSNAALVLFTENNISGWLFPNPKLAFSTAAVKEVFLDLTETEYQARKFELKPKPAVRVDDCRWKVATS